jgi:DNA-binding CsgD family transcriptional regulator
MAFDTRAALAREAVARLADGGLDPQELLHEAAARVRRVVPYELAGWMTMDPDTLLPTGADQTDKPRDLIDAIWRNELFTPDVHKFTDLARRRDPVAVLSTLDAATVERSPRHQVIHQQAGLGDEARVVLRASGSTWGAACLHRASDSGDFTAGERQFLVEISTHLGRGLQLSLSGRRTSSDLCTGPGVVTMDPELRVISTTADAGRLVGLLPADGSATVFGVAGRVYDEHHPARARVRLADGTWLLVHASRLGGAPGEPERVAVVLDRARPSDITSLLLRLHGLSARERAVAELLLSGRRTDELSARLCISRHTLRDHIKAIFAKVGASSRSELMAMFGGYGTPDLV